MTDSEEERQSPAAVVAGPKPQVERSQDFIAAYANNVQVETSAWDVTLVFGQHENRQGNTSLKQRAAITLPWAELKYVCNLLLTNVAFYEFVNGSIKMPRGMTPDAFTLPGGDTNAEVKALNERTTKIREFIFGKEQVDSTPST
jgi:uncharacterized protein DUF3467